eukprot:8456968-Pyramimonas_sp.AAC.1
MPKWASRTHAGVPQGASVEIPMGPRNAVLGGRRTHHWGFRRCSLWGHEAQYCVGAMQTSWFSGTHAGVLQGAS